MAKNRPRSSLLVFLGLALVAFFLVSCAWRDPNVRKQKYYNSGVSYFEKGKYREAAIQLENAIKIDPKYADAHYQLAQCYIKLGMWPGAFAELNRTVDLAPRNWKAQIDLGNLLFAARQFAKAEDKANLVLAAEPQNVDAHTLLAKALAAMGNSPRRTGRNAEGHRTCPRPVHFLHRLGHAANEREADLGGRGKL